MPDQTAAVPGDLLARAADDRRTGALTVAGHGAVFLVDGLVVYAESPAAPGVGELLTASGRLAGRTWQAALDAGPGAGPRLVDEGHLTPGELELCVLGATYDAAFFALGGSAAAFRDAALHQLGTVVRVPADAVIRECRRRARLLAEIYPDARVDASPVVPVPRAPRERLTLTALQWELLVHADGRRTPADLAQLLGRAGYATVQELRRLTAAGLIEPPGTPARSYVRLPGPRGTAAVPTAAPVSPPPAATAPLPQREPPPPELPHAGPPVAPPRRVPEKPVLDRRRPGAELPPEVAGRPVPPAGTDEVLLKRLRTALRALR